MANRTSASRLLRSATLCLLFITAAARPARAGEGADHSRASPRSVGAQPALTAGVPAPGPWYADPLREAVEGAALKLETPTCAAVLEAFTQLSGRPLRERLDQLGVSPSDYVRGVLFHQGFDEPACRRHRHAYAFTAPGHRVVRVCRPMATLASSRPEDAQAVIIHEVLHTLGLGENPPSSFEITACVRALCFLDAPTRGPSRADRNESGTPAAVGP